MLMLTHSLGINWFGIFGIFYVWRLFTKKRVDNKTKNFGILNSNSKATKYTCIYIGGATGEHNIAEMWKNHFAQLYN